MTDSPSPPYTRTAVALHWILALALAGLFGMGLYMADLPLSPLRIKLFNWHKWAGICVLALSLLRLFWRLSHRPPALPEPIEQAMPSWQLPIYHALHWVFYALFLLVPLIGWAYSSAAGFQVVLFGVLPLPNWVPHDKALADWIKPWHEISAWTLACLVVLHVAAALKHHFVDRDGLLKRMRFKN